MAMDMDDFRRQIKLVRARLIPGPRQLVEEAIKASPYYEEEPHFFVDNATEVLYGIRLQNWTTFLDHERDFNIEMGEILVKADPEIKNANSKSPEEIIGSFLEKYSLHLFELSKSNTNSRRSRAGKEFEAIIETILLRAGIMFDNQGIIGSKLFETERLGKLVDCVIPGVIEYNLEKRRCALVSMKTSLRERWQEVPEEMKRTGAQEMFLMTLDSGISKNTIESLASHNITLVVPDDLKERHYNGFLSVYGLTQFMFEMIEKNNSWIQRRDLPAGYYKDKLITINARLEGLSDPYERAIFVRMKRHCIDQLRSMS